MKICINNNILDNLVMLNIDKLVDKRWYKYINNNFTGDRQ